MLVQMGAGGSLELELRQPHFRDLAALRIREVMIMINMLMPAPMIVLHI
jgi:hypothetical protein